MTIMMKRVKALTNPVFIPNLEPAKHMALLKVLKQVFDRNAGHFVNKVYTTIFWGMSAEIAALTVAKDDKIDLQGRFRVISFLMDSGKKKAQIGFCVNGATRSDGLPFTIGEFDYGAAAVTGKFGNARVYIRGKGFMAQFAGEGR